MSLNSFESEEYDTKAPRPIDADSVASGAFARLDEGQGAVAAKRTPASADASTQSSEPSITKRNMAILVVAALAVICFSVFLFVRVLDAPSAATAQSEEVEQTSVATSEPISYRGSTYSLQEGDKGYELIEVKDKSASEKVTLGEIKGTPAGFVLYNGTIIVPENLSDGTWDVMAYTIGSGWSQIMNQEGKAQGGTGSIGEVALEGSNLVLNVDGTRTEVPLAW